MAPAVGETDGKKPADLKEEIRQNLPFRSKGHEAYLSLLRTADMARHRFAVVIEGGGVTLQQYNVLRILRGEGKPMPCLEVADRMIQVVPAITGLIDRLEKQELVGRERCTEDRRVVYIEITKKALALLNRMDEPVNELHKQLVGHLTRSELKELGRLLEKARTSLQRIED